MEPTPEAPVPPSPQGRVSRETTAALGLAASATSVGVPLGDEQLAALAEFEALLLDRAVALGIVARSDVARLRERHVLDSLRAALTVLESDRDAYDIGSGAGLPGIPVAIARPALVVRLVEPRRARVAFLELARDRLGLGNVEIVPRAVDAIDAPTDLCFTRAFAPLRDSWDAVVRLLRPGGRLVYFAGVSFTQPEPPPGCSALAVVPATGHLIESSGPLVIMTR